ncbi:MAG: T9SS type A sorting domain-containing protein, partial [Lentimicrobiaceae bacterium]|nr:T9SS type A sorting domain-containing protein [Lentimicrobiaceae bacterium]
HNEYSNGNQTISLDMKNVKPGVYFINCLIGGKSETKKIIKMR